MKFCSTCKEEFADKFSFCPVDGTPLTVPVVQPEQKITSAPAIADREQALANVDYLTGFAKLDPYPPQLAALARVAENLPSNGAQLAAWSYQSGDLQFTIFSPVSSLDILFYVKTYSSIPGFTDVTAERAEGPRSLRIKLHLAR